MKLWLTLAALLAAATPAQAFFSHARKAASPPAAPAPPPEPLDPLTTAEIDGAAQALRDSRLFSDSAVYLSIALQEPSKDEPGAGKRLAAAVIYDRARRETSEAVVDVANRKLESWRLVPGIEPGLSDEELSRARKLALSDSRFKAAMAARGRKTWDDLEVDGWSPGPLDAARNSPHRVARLDFYVPAARGRVLIDGLQALADLTEGTVVELLDAGGPPLPPPAQAQAPAPAPPPQPAKKKKKREEAPAPAAPSYPFEVAGHELRWRGWTLRYALTPREGLVLYEVSRDGRGIADRASLSETFVVYGDARPQWADRSVFQEGERGLGLRDIPLDPALDAPSQAAFFDEPGPGPDGRGRMLTRAVAVFERDAGRGAVRRLKELVLESKAQAGPETYVTRWTLGDDGELDAGVDVSQDDPEAPPHQHFFNFRVDFDVDGSTDSVAELEAAPGRMTLLSTPLENRSQARRDVDEAAGRRWLVTASSPSADASRGYLIIPEGNAAPLSPAFSPARRAAPFIGHQLWITAYRPDELYAAGEFPGRRARAGGVERWTQRDEPIRDADLVVWYTLGATHLPRADGSARRPLSCRLRLVPAGR